jgi:hypothetical protein
MPNEEFWWHGYLIKYGIQQYFWSNISLHDEDNTKDLQNIKKDLQKWPTTFVKSFSYSNKLDVHWFVNTTLRWAFEFGKNWFWFSMKVWIAPYEDDIICLGFPYW